MKVENTFEDFLMEKHSEQYVGLGDDMPDDFSDWLSNLDIDEFLDYGTLYGLEMNRKGYKEAADDTKKILTSN
jgi:hypothetical protein